MICVETGTGTQKGTEMETGTGRRWSLETGNATFRNLKLILAIGGLQVTKPGCFRGWKVEMATV